MISNSTIQSFLKRKLDNYDWVKRLRHQNVDAALEGLVQVELTAPLWLHQKACLLIMQYHPRFMFHVEMGGGKSLLMLSMIRHRKQKGEKPKAIVFVPYITAASTWLDETAKFAPELKCHALISTTEENKAALASEDADLFVICYQSAVALVASKEAKEWSINPEIVKQCFTGFDTLILDEIQKTKNHRSLTFQMLRVISDQVEYAYGLTGTPFGRDLQDLWSQFFLIDFGDTLGKTISFYRTVFFKRTKNFFGYYEFKFIKKLMPDLQRMIKNKSIRYSVDEFSDMPPKQYIQKQLLLPPDVEGYVEQAKGKLREALAGKARDYHVIDSAYIQLRQLSSGFMTFKDDEGGKERIKVEFENNHKLDALCDLVEAMPPDCKMVVFHEFVFTNEMISKRLTDLKVGHARVWGGQGDPIGQLRSFKEDNNCKVLIINNKSGSSSLNLQNASYIVFFEQPSSSIDRIQAEARCWRPGQLKRVFIYDLLVSGTYDKKLMLANKAGENLLQKLLDGKEEV